MSNRIFLILLLLLFVTALTPLPWGGRWLNGPVSQLLAPISDPVGRLAHVVRPARSVLSDDDPEVERLTILLEQAEVRIRNLEARAADLAEQVRRLQENYATDVDRTLRFLTADRISTAANPGSRAFRINAGRNVGLAPGAVVVADNYQLVGRVVEVDALTSTVLPITDDTPGDGGATALAVTLERGDEFASPSPISLEPTGEGTLIGRADASLPIQPGDKARLNDMTWGSSHTGLLVGRVTSVQQDERNPLWSIIEVRPDIAVDRVAEVILRIPRRSTPRALTPDPNRDELDTEGGSG
ncbi:MAG: rod shape-determining protein MreC [Planctomycetota bacterium]